MKLSYIEHAIKYHVGITYLSDGWKLVTLEDGELYLQSPYDELIYIHDEAHLRDLLIAEEVSI